MAEQFFEYSAPIKPNGDVRLFSEDPLTGITTFFYPLNDEGDFQLVAQQDFEPFMQDALDERNAHPSKASKQWDDVNKVAVIPMILVAELARKGIIFDQEEFRKWLNDPDNRVWRTKLGRV